ncbi:MAG: type II toxin-antitoxin system VapC family toxin [Nitrospirae bacterium]|nr:type II toxin-antitoxin system VapC family toxin [Nitrospirota bacterium]
MSDECYVDTSAFIAFLDGSDSFHSLFQRLFADPPRLITSPLVIAEGHGWFLRRYDAPRALQFLRFIEALATLQIMAVGPEEIRAGEKFLRKFMDQRITLTDAVGLLIMEKRRHKICWSSDAHLGLTGARLVIHSS